MPAKNHTWTCQRSSNSIRCRYENPNRFRNCRKCGKPRPKKKRPAHMVALDLTYEEYIQINGGEHCGICGKKRKDTPNPARCLDRDHDHVTRKPRGLLCRDCNRKLKRWATREWLWAALAYLRRAANRA